VSIEQRLRRLEEAGLLEWLEGLAGETEQSLETVRRDYEEARWRLMRGGWDAVVRWIAEENGISEAEVRALGPEPAATDESE
jgi:hypothetical protein